MPDLNIDSIQEVKEAVQMYENMQEAYNTYLAVMGFQESITPMASATSNIGLSDMNISTMGAIYTKQSCNVSRNF